MRKPLETFHKEWRQILKTYQEEETFDRRRKPHETFYDNGSLLLKTRKTNPRDKSVHRRRKPCETFYIKVSIPGKINQEHIYERLNQKTNP